MENKIIPEVFRRLCSKGCIEETDILKTEDGFWLANRSLSDILQSKNILDVTDAKGNTFACKNFFDDWYLYAVSCESGTEYSLVKMREQEFDAEAGICADGDIPGVTVSFIGFSANVLTDCLDEPNLQNRKNLWEEINRVAAYRGQKHSEKLKRYFVRTEAQGAYLVAKTYAKHIASFVKNGCISVPEGYLKNNGRLLRFIEENNKKAGKAIFEHGKIYFCDSQNPNEHEVLTILATHTGNTSVFSFAAEVQFHAKFLAWWAKIPIPFVGRSPYESAIRADMSIGDAEFAGPAPYYNDKSFIVKKQYHCHQNENY